MPATSNTFSTGQVPVRERSHLDVPDPDGDLGYNIITRLARGESTEAIMGVFDLTREQVDGLRPYADQAVQHVGVPRV